MYSLDSSSRNGGGRQRTDWTSEMDHYFIELMLDQVGRGNKLANTFNKQAWADMLALFNAKFGPHHGKRVLRHRHKKLSKYYSDVTLLLKQQGFSWSETQRMVVADDQVWDSYTKVLTFFFYFLFLYVIFFIKCSSSKLLIFSNMALNC